MLSIMTFSPDEIFTFTWKIENFSMCPQAFKQMIKSPAFAVNVLENVRWNMWLCPRGDRTLNDISCYLARTEDPEQNFEVCFQFTVISSNAEMNVKTLIRTRDFKQEPAWGFGKLCSRDEVFDAKSLFLTNDVFTVNCHMWKAGFKHEDVNNVIDSRNEKCSTGKCSSNINECCGVTRIPIESTSLLWSIKKFSKLRSEEKLVKTVSSAKKDEPTLELTLYLTESENGHCVQLDVRRIVNSDCFKNVFVRCRVKTLGAPKGIRYQGEDEHHFVERGDLPWKFPQFITKEKILNDKYLYYTDDVLHLHCELTFAVQQKNCNFVEDSSVHPVYQPSNLNVTSPTHFLDQLRNENEFSDFTIRTAEKEFKVHKCVLGMRSPVFKAMFQTRMQEKELGVVNITDVDADILDKMITFVYTDTLDELNQRDAVGLYSAANKYDVQPLICRCRCVLMSNLSVCTASEILHLADVYQDEELSEAVRSFIHVNTSEVFYSKAWKDFKQNNYKLASDMMIRIFTEKYLD